MDTVSPATTCCGGFPGLVMRQSVCKSVCVLPHLPPRWANAKFRLYCGKKRVVASFWSKAKQRWPDRVLALAYGAAGFDGSGTVGCRGVPVSQMLKEALSQFPAGRVLIVDEFRTSRVSSAYSNPGEGPPQEPP
ncbi:uncharacterized protein HaLaN_21818 [Haematococcus lacustris]|uniref:Uncharacterized protein n=1 Tax=Haematococcus lacustris TaxID=44745 RepID=A0A699ZN37_HAELA|nr:uncharacterized protein HaLaN_21818 [Haematococcus lacustris]